MLFFSKTGPLTDENIDAFAEEIVEAYKSAVKDLESGSVLKFRLGLEEILLRFRDSYGNTEDCTINAYRNIYGSRIEILQKGQQFNPLLVDTDDEFTFDLLARLDMGPKYSYVSRKGLNCVTLPAPKPKAKNTLLKQLFIGLILAIITCVLTRFLPETFINNYLQPGISSIFRKLSSLFSAIATPLVFCAVIAGISGLGDAASFGKIGTKFIARMMITYLIADLIMIIVGALMGLISMHGDTGGGNVFIQLLDLTLDMIPGNLVEPFRIDNDLQVIVLSVFVGLTILLLGEKVQNVRNFIIEAGDVVNKMMLTVCKLLPLFVYLGICDLYLGGRLNNMGHASKAIILSLSAASITIAYMIIRTKITVKRPLKEILKAQMPPLMINLTTSSQVSALPASMDCCKKGFGIDKKFVDFGLPFGIVVYMPNGAIVLGSIAWVLAAMSTGAVDIMMVIKIVIVATVVAIAAPPIPGSALAVLPILFSASGTDTGLMPIGVIVTSTVGYLLPAMNGFCLQLELYRLAYDMDLIKKK